MVPRSASQAIDKFAHDWAALSHALICTEGRESRERERRMHTKDATYDEPVTFFCPSTFKMRVWLCVFICVLCVRCHSCQTSASSARWWAMEDCEGPLFGVMLVRELCIDDERDPLGEVCSRKGAQNPNESQPFIHMRVLACAWVCMRVCVLTVSSMERCRGFAFNRRSCGSVHQGAKCRQPPPPPPFISSVC